MTSVDVANESGVSQATVARAFNNPDVVSPDTLERVRSAAERLGYVPNALARGLKNQRSGMVGAVVPAHGEYWQHAITAFSRGLADRDQQLVLFSLSDRTNTDEVLDHVAQYQLDAVVLASAVVGKADLARMQAAAVPVVAFNQPAAAGIVASVSADNAHGSAKIASHLIALGIRSALFVGGSQVVSTDQLRYGGAARELGEAGIALPYLEAGSFFYEDGFKAAGQLLDRGPLPDALMVAGDELAFGVLDGLASAGVSVPDDVFVTGFDGLPQASWNAYDLTTLVQPTEVLVETALDVVLSGDIDPTHHIDIVVPGTIRHGATTRRIDHG